MYFGTSVYEESYKRANMKPMSKEVKQRRQKMIGDILKQDQCNDLGNRRKKKKRKTKDHLEEIG